MLGRLFVEAPEALGRDLFGVFIEGLTCIHDDGRFGANEERVDVAMQ